METGVAAQGALLDGPVRRHPAGPAELPRLAEPHRLDLADRQRPPVAELRYEIAELVAGIGHGQRLRPLGDFLAGKDRRQPLVGRAFKIEA